MKLMKNKLMRLLRKLLKETRNISILWSFLQVLIALSFNIFIFFKMFRCSQHLPGSEITPLGDSVFRVETQVTGCSTLQPTVILHDSTETVTTHENIDDQGGSEELRAGSEIILGQGESRSTICCDSY